MEVARSTQYNRLGSLIAHTVCVFGLQDHPTGSPMAATAGRNDIGTDFCEVSVAVLVLGALAKATAAMQNAEGLGTPLPRSSSVVFSCLIPAGCRNHVHDVSS